MLRQVNGILLLDKPEQMTSNCALQCVKRIFQAKKAGHTGSLDPIATGMLPLCFGEATKFSQFLLESDKSYRVIAQLGVETKTGDSEGNVTSIKDTLHVTIAGIQQVLQAFVGVIEQVPPMFSALKYQGKPLYELARKGIEVKRMPRSTTIFSIEFESLDRDQLTFHVHCSKGTYIRTLVEDIGRALGCGAHVIGLRRLNVAGYHHADMYKLQQLENIFKERSHLGLSACLLPVETAVKTYPAVKLSTSAAFYLRLGQPVRAALPLQSSLVRLLTEDARFLGVGEVMNDGRVKPHRLISEFSS